MPRQQAAGTAIPLPKGWPRRVRSAVIHTISLAHASLTHAPSVAANSVNARIRLKEEIDRLRNEIFMLKEEIRIKDARWEVIPPHRRPHYPPTERLAILELRAARCWSQAQTGKRFLITPATVASWMVRLDEEGPAALVQTSEPVNKYPDFVGYLVRRLKVLCPTMGKTRIANVLCRAGLHLGATTVRRMLTDGGKPKNRKATATKSDRVVTARRPNHLAHLDLTTVPTALGFWVPWLPLALPQRWPFCWWIAIVVDQSLLAPSHGSGGFPQTAVVESRPVLSRSSDPRHRGSAQVSHHGSWRAVCREDVQALVRQAEHPPALRRGWTIRERRHRRAAHSDDEE